MKVIHFDLSMDDGKVCSTFPENLLSFSFVYLVLLCHKGKTKFICLWQCVSSSISLHITGGSETT